MNCGPLEVAAFFWDKLVPGAMASLDDYAFTSRPQDAKTESLKPLLG
jgi:hypothetical protein